MQPGRKALADIGFLGITVPEAAGGAGGSVLDLAVVAEQGGRGAGRPVAGHRGARRGAAGRRSRAGRRGWPTARPRSPSSTVPGRLGARPWTPPTPTPSSRSTAERWSWASGVATPGARRSTPPAGWLGAAHLAREVLIEDAARALGARASGRRGGARRRGPRCGRPGGGARRRLRQGAAGVRPADRLLPGDQAPAGRRVGRAWTSCARWCGGRPGPPTRRRPSCRWRPRRRRRTPPGVLERAAETLDPGARRHRLHLGARRAPVLAAGEGRPVRSSGDEAEHLDAVARLAVAGALGS